MNEIEKFKQIYEEVRSTEGRLNDSMHFLASQQCIAIKKLIVSESDPLYAKVQELESRVNNNYKFNTSS